jgi:threonine/homoserine/homoserine lactone efflux protein
VSVSELAIGRITMELFIKGIILGFSIAAPVGPIGLLCIRRTLAEGKLHGFVSGLGAATADAFYGFIAAFGLNVISSLLLEHQFSIRWIGLVFLFYLAARIFISKPASNTKISAENTNLIRSYTSTLFLTLTNPATILSFIAVFAGFGVGTDANNYFQGSLIVMGVFLGSALWWLLLSSFIGLFRERLNTNALGIINKISAVLLILLGIFSVLSMQ